MRKSTTHRHISPKALLGLILALTVTFLLLLSTISVAEKYMATRRHIRDLTNEKAALERKYETLETRNAYFATPEGKEQVLREKYNVAKPGEGIVVIVTPTFDGAVATDSDTRSWWQKLFAGLGLHKK